MTFLLSFPPSHHATADEELVPPSSGSSPAAPIDLDEQDRLAAARFLEQVNRVYLQGVYAAIDAICYGCGDPAHESGQCAREPRYKWDKPQCGCTVGR